MFRHHGLLSHSSSSPTCFTSYHSSSRNATFLSSQCIHPHLPILLHASRSRYILHVTYVAKSIQVNCFLCTLHLAISSLHLLIFFGPVACVISVDMTDRVNIHELFRSHPIVPQRVTQVGRCIGVNEDVTVSVTGIPNRVAPSLSSAPPCLLQRHRNLTLTTF